MAIYDLTENSLVPLVPTTFALSDIKEREHLQQLLKNQIEVISPNTLVISEEFSNWDSRRRIDLLGIDTDGNLVVIELKRTEDGGHMELQSLRYATMVSPMTFDQALDLFQDFLDHNKIEAEARRSLLEFLDWESEEENEFAQEVRIVLAAAEFSKEITTTVLWLNENGLDIRCVRLRPYKDGERTLVDFQQAIPLPEAGEYQVQMKQKNRLEQVSRKSSRDLTKFTIKIDDQIYEGLAKRRAIQLVVNSLFDKGIDAEAMATTLSWYKRAFMSFEGELDEDTLVKHLIERQIADGVKPSPRRYFCDDGDLLRRDGRTLY